MSSNLEKFKKDLERLTQMGLALSMSLKRDLLGKKVYDERIRKENGNSLDKILENLPNFSANYQPWYSEATVVIKQIIPDRLDDFKAHYQRPKNRKELTNENYRIEDCLHGLSVSHAGKITVDQNAAVPLFDQQVAILKSAERRFESSLFDIKQLVQADLFDSELDGARELLKNKFNRGAGIIAGVLLEKHLKQVCMDHGIKSVKKKPTVSTYNDLLRENGVIDIPEWRRITHLGDLRNISGHARKSEPTETDINHLIDGVARTMKTVH